MRWQCCYPGHDLLLRHLLQPARELGLLPGLVLSLWGCEGRGVAFTAGVSGAPRPRYPPPALLPARQAQHIQ